MSARQVGPAYGGWRLVRAGYYFARHGRDSIVISARCDAEAIARFREMLRRLGVATR